jgi:hypothetical protein
MCPMLCFLKLPDAIIIITDKINVNSLLSLEPNKNVITYYNDKIYDHGIPSTISSINPGHAIITFLLDYAGMMGMFL